MLLNNHDNLYKSRISHNFNTKMAKHNIRQKLDKNPSTSKEPNKVSFKGGFSINGIKKAFAPHISKSYQLDENLKLLKKYIGKAPIQLSKDTSTWVEIAPYLKRSADNKTIEIVEKNWPTLLWEGIIYPFKELPLHIGKWGKGLISPNSNKKAEGIFKTLDNTDIVNSMSGYMETASKLKHDNKTIQSANLFTRAMKSFDPKTGNYNGVHERALTRVVRDLYLHFS